MPSTTRYSAVVLGLCFIIGAGLLGWILGQAAVEVKEYERSVTVKGLAEREVAADIVIWPISFTDANNNLTQLYSDIETSAANIRKFLNGKGIKADEISVAAPSITDKSAQQYGGMDNAQFRYAGMQTVTVYSENVALVREAMNGLSDLGKQGIVLNTNTYENQVEYIYTRLNDIKPEMIEEATNKAREVANKFAEDSQSRLGKIKQASQGQFTIEPRDKNNPHIKNVRVVSTVEYYLSD